jgi:hypothetical protein
MRTGYEIPAAELWTTHTWTAADAQIRGVQWLLTCNFDGGHAEVTTGKHYWG